MDMQGEEATEWLLGILVVRIQWTASGERGILGDQVSYQYLQP